MVTNNYLQDNADYIKKVSQLLSSDNSDNIELGFQIVKGAGKIPAQLYPVLTNNRYKVWKCLEYDFIDLLDTRPRIEFNYLRLTQLPQNLPKLKNLKKIGLSGNPQLNNVATFELLAQIPNLEAIDLFYWNLNEVPPPLLTFKNIKSLGLGSNPHLNLDRAFAQLMELPRLEYLSLYNNKLEALPESILLLNHLKKLDLSDNNFEGLPALLKKLPNLKHLELCDNQGTDYWDHFWDIENEDARKLQKEFPGLIITFG